MELAENISPVIVNLSQKLFSYIKFCRDFWKEYYAKNICVM